MLSSDKSIWLKVEEVVRINNFLDLSCIDELKQTCKFMRILSHSTEYSKDNIYVVKVSAIMRKRINSGHGNETALFIPKSAIEAVLENEHKYFTTIKVLKDKHLKDEHGGIPRLEYC